MEPEISEGSIIIVSNIFYLFKNPQISDIVAFRRDNKVMVKRISKIIKGKYFLEGDNKKDSFDSNRFGLISKEQILGKVIFKS